MKGDFIFLSLWLFQNHATARYLIPRRTLPLGECFLFPCGALRYPGASLFLL